jgi:salicylate hydroxylase
MTSGAGTAATGRAGDGTIIVIGGGIGGLTAATALARKGASVILLEQAPALTEVGAGLQITPNGAAVLHRLGLSAALDDWGIRARAVVPTDALSGHPVARFALDQLPGQPYRFLHRADLVAILADAARAAGVELRTGTQVAAVTADAIVTLADGRILTPDLAIGADGLHSVLRPVLNGDDAPFFTGQVAWRAIIPAKDEPVARIWMAPGRHVVTYPLPGGRINIVAVREQAEWAAEGWHHPDDPAQLQAAFADTCPALCDLLAQVSAPRLWGLFRHPVALRWHGARTAILGDAAHPTLPFLAQGANLAIEDAWVLARVVAEARAAGTDFADALPRYQALRHARVTRAIKAANANAVNYHLAGLRRRVALVGLSALGRLAPGAFLNRLDWLYGHDVTA